MIQTETYWKSKECPFKDKLCNGSECHAWIEKERKQYAFLTDRDAIDRFYAIRSGAENFYKSGHRVKTEHEMFQYWDRFWDSVKPEHFILPDVTNVYSFIGKPFLQTKDYSNTILGQTADIVWEIKREKEDKTGYCIRLYPDENKTKEKLKND